MLVLQYKIDCRVTIELLDTETEDNEKNLQNAKTWNTYVERLTNPLETNELVTLNQTSGSTAKPTTNSNMEDSLAIKEEKLEEDVVSEHNFASIDFSIGFLSYSVDSTSFSYSVAQKQQRYQRINHLVFVLLYT